MTNAPPHVARQSQPCFLVLCRDNPDYVHLRMEHLDGHLEHVENHWRRYVVAGPLREPGGDQIIGSAFLVLADTVDDAKALMNADPYITSDLYASVEYRDMTLSIGQFVGGKIWDSPEAIRHRALGGPKNDPAQALNE